MIKWSLRSKIMLSVGLIIFVVLGTSTIVHVQFLQRDYFESIEWRSEALAQSIVNEIVDIYRYIPYTPGLLEGVSLRCNELYRSNKEKDVSHVAVINAAGIVVVHSDQRYLQQPVPEAHLREHIERQEQTTVLEGMTYHTLVPVFGTQENIYLGTVDIGFPRQVVDEKVRQIFFNSVALFVFFLVVSCGAISLLMHLLLTKPVNQLVRVGQRLAAGTLVHAIQTTGSGDEISTLSSVFSRIAHYLHHIAEVASHVATGEIDREARMRSEHDVLGKAVRDMLAYLNHIATVARQIAEGNLTANVPLRSSSDVFGQTIQAMLDGLRALIIKIRASSDQLVTTEKTISSLATHDIHIVQEVHTSAEAMTSTLREMGQNTKEVAANMEILSSSVAVTSASIAEITASITQIAAHTQDLTQQTHETISCLEKTTISLEEVVENTTVSKQLSAETIQDALDGQKDVEQVMNSMETIHRTVTSAVDSITQFARRSQDITTILDVIREITDQTSLLALNASIIAAQAGSHGRGFAVVADEIRNLAQRVEGSTKDIASIVTSLHQDTDRVVQTIHAGAEDVRQGMERTNQARATLQKIRKSAERSSTVVTTIADTLQEVMSDSRTLSGAMERVNGMTDEMTTAITQHEASTRQINLATENVNEMAIQVQQATAEQLTGVLHVIQAMQTVTDLVDSNLKSSQRITETTRELALQAELLLESVDRFKLGN